MIQKHTPFLKGPLLEATGLLFTLPPLSTYLTLPTSSVSLQRGHYDTHTEVPQDLNPLSTPSHIPSRFTNLNIGISHTHGLQHSAVPLGPGGARGEKRRGEPPHLPLTSFSPPPSPPTREGRGNPPQSGSKVCGSGDRDCWLNPS